MQAFTLGIICVIPASMLDDVERVAVGDHFALCGAESVDLLAFLVIDVMPGTSGLDITDFMGLQASDCHERNDDEENPFHDVGILFDKFDDFFLGCAREKLTEVGDHAAQRLLRRAVTLAGLFAEQLLGCGEQCPAPAVFFPVLVTGIDKVLGDDAASHLQARDVAVKTASRLRLSKTAESAQVTRNETAVLAQGHQNGFLDGARRWSRMIMTAPIVQVGPPGAADKARLLVKKLAIDAFTLGNDRTFPVPQGPVPTAVF